MDSMTQIITLFTDTYSFFVKCHTAHTSTMTNIYKYDRLNYEIVSFLVTK